MEHDKILVDLEHRLKKFCAIVGKQQNYVLENGVCGEYDLAGYRSKPPHGIVFAIEVKRTDNLKNHAHAMQQLQKDYVHFREMLKLSHEKIRLFYAFTDPQMRRGYDVHEIRFERIGHYFSDMEDRLS